jgi:polyribonucleotide 5'-hydroxyl-kinase
MAPSSALPVGATRVVSEMQPLQVDPAMPGSGLLNAVLALLAQPDEDERDSRQEGSERILDMTVSGFLVVCVISSCHQYTN